MANINYQKRLLEAIEAVVTPIEFAIESVDKAKIFFRNYGWDFDQVEGFLLADFIVTLSDIEELIADLKNLIQNPPDSFEDLESALDTTKSLLNFINSIATLVSGFSGAGVTAKFKEEFGKLGKELVDNLICGFIETHSPKVYAVLSVLGIITPHQLNDATDIVLYENEPWVRLPHYSSSIHLGNLIQLLKNPVAYFKELYYPVSGELNTDAEAQEFSDRLFPRLELLFQSLGFDTYYGIDERNANLFTLESFSILKRTLTVIHHASDSTTYGASLVVSPTSEGGNGLVVKLFGEWNYNIEIKNWLLFIQATASVDAFAIKDSGISFPSSLSDISFRILLLLSKLNNDNNLVGSTTGTRFAINKSSVYSFLEYKMEKANYGFFTEFNGIEFFIGGEGDSFINKILPNGANGKFDLKFGWDSINGFHFNTSGGLVFNFPLHQKIGPVEFKGMKLGVYLENLSLSIKGGASISLDLGVLALSVDNVGIKADISFPTANANLGVCDLNIGFKFPDGVALAINAPPVKGAGFLDYNAATSTYTGGLELTFSKISFSAIGIISTKLPGGKEGYSLLIIITAEFSPIQLGMGFTLTGLGGLLGLNRTMNPDVLRTGLRDKTLDSILFPKDIINNKDTIISNIGQAFPVMEGQFMVGPMAKIGWGTPTLITIELGIILEFPEPVRLAILGVLRAILPSEDKSVLKLQINFLGIIDFTAKYLSFDASIYDSKILTFPLMGDMALRLYWGDKPNFLMSVGGFHPRYTPPPLNLPELRRLSLVLASDKNLSIGIEACVAITSNSVQFGAKVAAKAILLKGKVEVLGALWFDILFQFSPFYFVADMGVLFSIRWKGKELLTLFINLMLEGPNPWRAQGKGTFKILGIGISVSFDKTFGQTRTETIAPVPLDTKFSEALSHKDNWGALLPERSHQQVSWKDAADSTELIVDSGGQLRFSQRLLPLNIDLSKYGTAPISDTRKFKIQGVTAGQDGIPGSPTPMDTEKVFDLFARNEFFNMTDDEKLSKDPYEPFESGVLIGSDALSAEYAVHRKIDYENIVLDAGYRKRNSKWDLSAALMNVHLMDSYVSASALSDFVAVSDHGGPSKVAVSRAEETFVVINRENMGMATATHFASSADADAFLVQARATNTSASEWYVANSFELA